MHWIDQQFNLWIANHQLCWRFSLYIFTRTCNTSQFATEFGCRRPTVWQCIKQLRISLPPQDLRASGSLSKYHLKNELIVPESFLALNLHCTSRALFLWRRKITINFVNSVAAQHLSFGSGVASQIAVSVTGSDGLHSAAPHSQNWRLLHLGLSGVHSAEHQ